jgi:two-component system, NarL family, sensor kinase
MIKGFLFVVFVGGMIPLETTAQQRLADSVEALLKKDMPDSNRAVSLVYRAFYYELIDSAKSQQYYKEAIEFATKKKQYYAAGLGLHYSIYLDLVAGKYWEHLPDIENIIQYLSQSNSEPAMEQLGLVMDSKASYFFREGEYDSASVWYLKGIATLERIGKDNRLYTTYSNLAALYQTMNLRDKQKEYILKGFEAAKRMGEPQNTAVAYSNLSDYYYIGQDYALALSYSDSAARFLSELSDLSKKQYFYAVRGQAFEGVRRFDSAAIYYSKSIEIAKKLGNVWNVIEPTLRLGSTYLEWGKHPQAEIYIKEGIQLAEHNHLLVFLKLGYGLLSKYYEKIGNLNASLESYKHYYAVNDTLQNEERKKAILNLDKKYETEKKEQQLKIQAISIRQKNILNYIFAGSLVGLLAITLLAYRNFQHKRKIQSQKIVDLEKEKQLLSTQSLLKGQEEERNRLAKDLHDGLGGLLSGVKLQLGAMKGNLVLSEEHSKTFNQALVKLDDSINEMRRVAHNMMPEALLNLGLSQALQDYCESLSQSQHFTINTEFHGLDKRLSSSIEIVVYRIVQELLNNAIKHSEASTIFVQVIRLEGNLSITVEDNGKGFDIKNTHLHQQAGLANVRSRVNYLSGKMDLYTEKGKGTSVHIECPVTSA